MFGSEDRACVHANITSWNVKHATISNAQDFSRNQLLQKGRLRYGDRWKKVQVGND